IKTPSAPTAAGREICPIIGRHPQMPAKPAPHRISVNSKVKNKSPTQLGSQSPTIAPKTRQSGASSPLQWSVACTAENAQSKPTMRKNATEERSKTETLSKSPKMGIISCPFHPKLHVVVKSVL